MKFIKRCVCERKCLAFESSNRHFGMEYNNRIQLQRRQKDKKRIGFRKCAKNCMKCNAIASPAGELMRDRVLKSFLHVALTYTRTKK